MDQPVAVPFAMIKMMPDLAETVSGEGTDGHGRRFIIQRYVSRGGARVYDCVFTTGAEMPTCAEIPAAEKPSQPE